MNGDRRPDLVATENGTVQVYLGNGDGTFNALPVWTPPPPNQEGAVALGDIDGDGNLDVAGYQSFDLHVANFGVYLGN